MKILLIALSLISTLARAQTANEAFCQKKWTDQGRLNKRMYDNCVDELADSDRQIAVFQKQHENEAWFHNLALSGCNERWTREGLLQTDLALYCYRQELAAFTELQYQSRLPSFSSASAEACYNVWKTSPGQALAKTFDCYRTRAEAPRPSLPKALQLLLQASGPSTETAGQSEPPTSQPN